MLVLYILFHDVILFCISAFILGAAIASAVILTVKRRNSPNAKPTATKYILNGLQDNRSDIAALLEPMYLLSTGRLERKEEVFSEWESKLLTNSEAEEFKTAYTKKIGSSEKWKGKKKQYLKHSKKLVKYLFKAGIERSNEIYTVADETTAEKYHTVGNLSIETDKKYDVLAPYWHIDNEILSKGVIR